MKFKKKNIKGTEERPRVVLKKTNRYLIVQAIDDKIGHTLFYSSTKDLKENNQENMTYGKKNKFFAEKLGENFAEKLKNGKKFKIVFDCNYPYYGKIQIFCDTMRKLGINF